MPSTTLLPYSEDDIELTGFLVKHDEVTAPRPGLLLVHGGAGLDDHAKGQAERYAALGFTVLACDMFGPDVAGDRDRIIATLTTLRDDPDLMSRRAQAGITALQSHSEVDGCAAAVGFCFGGMTVLTLARAGADLAGVVSMHGALATPRRAGPGSIKAKVLACHGALDPHVPMSDVAAFAEEMDEAGADWQLIMYGGAVHGFTHKDAVTGAIRGVAYDARTDERSFAAARAFLRGLVDGADGTETRRSA
jgi:dienelactone hydrolase